MRRAIPPHDILQGQAQVTTCLEDTTGLESPGDFAGGAGKEEPHFERVANDPVDNDAGTEAFAAFALVVGPELGDG